MKGLRQVEDDPGFKVILERVKDWAGGRNKVIHAMAKLGDLAGEAWRTRVEQARAVANDGIALLRDLDAHDRRLHHGSRRRRHASATCPDALAPIGQPDCEWCSPPGTGRRGGSPSGS
jgi:hypothetical protein